MRVRPMTKMRYVPHVLSFLLPPLMFSPAVGSLNLPFFRKKS